MYPKNNATPPAIDLGQILLLADGTIQTTGASVRVRIGTGAWGAGAGTLACDTTSGIWTYAPTQAETNAEYFIVAAYKADCSALSKTVITSDSSISGRVNVQTLQTDVITAAAFATSAVDEIVDAVYDEPMSGHTVNGSYGSHLVRSANQNQNTVQITGSQHIAADVHEFQPGVITSGDFAAGAITSTVLATDSITSSQIAASAVTEIQSGLATTTQLTTVEGKIDTIDNFVDTEVAAIKAVTDKLDTTVEIDGAVYRFTTNALEQGPSGSSTITVSPLSALAPERVVGTTISVAVGDLTPISVDVFDASDNPVNLSAQGNLEICIESRNNVDLQVVAHASITIGGTGNRRATWTPNAASVATVDKHRWSLRTASGKKVLAYGPWVVERVALAD